MKMLTDPHGRSFSYLRLSITDICNYRCQYCLPDGYQKSGDTRFLGADEIENLVAGLAGLGLWKVRLTGGEPTVRKDFAEIAARVSSVPGIRRVAATTNGYRLAENARLWREAGISAINVSVDSLNRTRFAEITVTIICTRYWMASRPHRTPALRRSRSTPSCCATSMIMSWMIFWDGSARKI